MALADLGAGAVTPGEAVVAGLLCAAVFIALILAGIWVTRGFWGRR